MAEGRLGPPTASSLVLQDGEVQGADPRCEGLPLAGVEEGEVAAVEAEVPPKVANHKGPGALVMAVAQ